MKKKQEFKAVEEMGVSIGEGAVLSSENKSIVGNYVVGLLLFTMMMIGTIECLVQGFSMLCMQKWLIFGILVSCLVFYTGFSGKRGGEIMVALYLVGYGVVSYLMRNYIANGLAVFVNTILKKAGKYYHTEFLSYEEQAGLDRQKSLTIFLVFVFVFLIGILAYLAAHKIASYFVIAITFLVAFAPEVVGLVPGEKVFALYTVSVLVYLGSRMWYKNRQNFHVTGAKVQWKIRLMQIVVGMLCVFLFFRVFTEDTYNKISRETDLKTFVQNVMQSWYNNTIRKTMDKGTVEGGISCGDISGVDRIQYSDTVRLNVKYKTLDLGQRAEGGLYLRGYIGSKYEGDQWEPLSEEQEAECRKMEENSQISLDDYDTATAAYRMGLEKFFDYGINPGNNVFHEGTWEELLYLNDNDGETDFLYKKYEPKTFREGMQSIYSQGFSNVIVENVSETVLTQFVPYYVASNVKEEQGKLSSQDTTDVGEYEWSIFNGQAEAFGVVTDPYISYYRQGPSFDYYDRTKMLWKEFLFIKEETENGSGEDVLDYKEGTYKGKTIEEVCPDLSEKLELTISGDTSKDVEDIDTDGEYDVNELLKILARENTSIDYDDMAASDMRALYSNIYYGMTDSELEEFQDEADSSSVSNYYEEEDEVETWQEMYGSELAVRSLCGTADADEFFSMLKYMYQFYIRQQEYENFVERTYLDVPEGLKGSLEKLVEEAGMKKEKELRKIIFFVQNYLYNNTEYSLEPGTTPEGEDFTEYFLFQNKRGYCVHYATAATMMLRSLGVPARYVEGYHADKDTLQNKDKVTMDGASLWHTVELTDRYAHAWVEIYISGYGWIPVEVTKAYLDLSGEQASDKIEKEDSEKTPAAQSTKKPSNTAKPIQQTTNPQSSTHENTIDLTKYYGLFRVLFGIAAVILAVASRYGIITKKHQKEESLDNANRAVYFYYTQMERMLRILKQCGKDQSLRQLLQEQVVKLDGIDADEWLRFYAVMNDYTFSKNGVTEGQATNGKQLYEMVRTVFYRKKKVWTHWYYKYIRCI